VTLGNSRTKQQDGMRRGSPARYRPVIAYRVVQFCKEEGGDEAVKRPFSDGAGDLVARGVQVMTLYHTSCEHASLQHKRCEERARICTGVYVLICSALLLPQASSTSLRISAQSGSMSSVHGTHLGTQTNSRFLAPEQVCNVLGTLGSGAQVLPRCCAVRRKGWHVGSSVAE